MTKDRVLLVDDDLVNYLMNDDSSAKTPDFTGMPPRLLQEHTEFLVGCDRGPLMKQELEFDRLFQKNMSMKNPLTWVELQKIQRQTFGPKGSVPICYCQIEDGSFRTESLASSRWSCIQATLLTSLTGSTTSRLADRGRPYRASRAVRPCKCFEAIAAETALTDGSVNWYQRNYPYVWAGARVVTDL